MAPPTPLYGVWIVNFQLIMKGDTKLPTSQFVEGSGELCELCWQNEGFWQKIEMFETLRLLQSLDILVHPVLSCQLKHICV